MAEDQRLGDLGRRPLLEPPKGPQWTVVLRGRFNPAIFQPAWLASHGLIRQEEAERAKGIVFAPDLVAFTADWLRMQVDEDRFEASALDSAHAGPLRDLVLGVFALLEHTPFEVMGLNHLGHYPLPEGEWSALQDEFAPKAPWNRIIMTPTLRTLTIQGAIEEAPGARIQIRIEPSLRLEHGICIATNEHYERKGSVEAGRELMAILGKRWDASRLYAQRIVDFMTSRRTV